MCRNNGRPYVLVGKQKYLGLLDSGSAVSLIVEGGFQFDEYET